MDPQIKKLLELAGTLEQHKTDEKKLFNEVCTSLEKLQTFCKKQREFEVYDPLAKCAKELCDKLKNHFDRY